jgi:hypothetical protein
LHLPTAPQLGGLFNGPALDLDNMGCREQCTGFVVGLLSG